MRKFLCLCIVAVMALCVSSAALYGAAGPKKHLGIATYSVKGFDSDIEGSLKALADDGYVVMEIANYDAEKGTVAGYKPVDFSALTKKYGLTVISSHARSKFDVKDEAGTLAAWGKVFDDHKLMGCKYVVFPMNMWAGTVEGVKAECDLMNKIGDEANLRGIKFGYHNHHIEFVTIPNTDKIYEDFLIANTNPDKVFFEMDVYWITIGGQDPVAYLKKYPSRFKALHIKDEYVVGATGKINYEAIFTQFYKNGYEDWFVEMEAKMNEEQKAQMMGMMDQMKKMQASGGNMNDMMARMAKNQPKGDQKPGPQGGAPPQGGKDAKPGQGAPPPGFGPQDPKVVAEQLKTSLEGIKQSAEYLMKSDFVK
jgi:sugar phosphate isomerase/epimerase